MRFKAISTALILFFLLICLLPAPVAADSFSVSTNTGPVGTEITISNICAYGSGDYSILWGESLELIKQGNAAGCQPVKFTVPDAARGVHKITLRIDSKTYEVNFTVLPSISLDIAQGTVDTSVTVTGRGFSANESGIQITFDQDSALTGINADARGYWQGTFKVPQTASGEHNIDAAGITPASDVNDVIFKVKPKIDINPKSGEVGTMVAVEGHGFGSGETNIEIIYDDLAVKTGISASSQGFWRSSFFVPASTQGVHTISAYGAKSAIGDVAGVLFTISPAIKLELASGVLGTAVNAGDSFWVNGVGFESNESGIQVTFDGNMLSSGIVADAKGSWAVKVDVPLTAQGMHMISASGSRTRAEDVTTASLMISPGIMINPISGAAGQEVSITGMGFGGNQRVTISFDGNQAGEPATTDSKGSFSLTITVPAARGGNHLITAADGTAAVASTTFEIESIAPPAPAPISPAPGEKLGRIGPTVVTFVWTQVDDPSGVNYVLELSRSPDFAGVVMRKEGLATNEYTLSQEEALDRGEYFWHVKAVDGALNESGWSAAQLINIRGFELLYIAIIALVAVVLLAAIIWRIVRLSKRGWK